MPEREHHITEQRDRISWNQLIAYGTGGIIPIALFNIAGQLMGLIGNIGLGLSAFWLGFILIIPRLWDAVSDPIIGHLSDNTRGKWGRRRPYVLIGGILVGLSFVAMWWVPKGEAVEAFFGGETAYHWFQLAFILMGLLVFFTSTTLFEIPHGALGMEMSNDYHERTRLFSAKSFSGNIFAMGTAGIFYLANLTLFRGPGGTVVDGLRYVSIMVSAVLIPLAIWWFFSLKEPGFNVVKTQEKVKFWEAMRMTLKNRIFMSLVLIIFTLAMGFNFVSLFGYYITIFYLYDGNFIAASPLLFWNGLIWGATGILAVFPLNWISRRIGKRNTLLLSIGLMCLAQLTKIVCYNPQLPYLVIIPTILLSAGMLMFFTLGPAMLGDVCDEDDLRTNTRREANYYSVFWWFIKMGTAFASFVTGILIVITHFDEKQTTTVDTLNGSIEILEFKAEKWIEDNTDKEARLITFEKEIAKASKNADELKDHFAQQIEAHPIKRPTSIN